MVARQLPLFPSDKEHALTRHSRLAEAHGPFLAYLRREGRSEHTLKAFASDLRLVEEYFGEDFVLKDFTTTRLNRFLEWLEHGRGVPCSRKSYARRVTTLKVFFKFLRSERVLPHDPAEALLQRSGSAPLQPVLTEEEVARLLAYTAGLRLAENPDPRPDLLARLLLDTGIKKSECMRLRPEDVLRADPEQPILIVRHPRPGNVYRERKIPLDPDWLPVLDDYLAHYRPQDTIFDCTARNLEYVLHDVALAAGITSRVSFEILRWTSAVRDYCRGLDPEELREKMGLSRISWRETSQKIALLADVYRGAALSASAPDATE
ncbi:MAG: tyrosine-type recombinase/integrase [Aggregatilineaceae bacterium]